MYQLTIGAMQQLAKLCDVMHDFLFQSISVGDWTFSMWQLLAGAFFGVMITAWFIKKLIPVA